MDHSVQALLYVCPSLHFLVALVNFPEPKGIENSFIIQSIYNDLEFNISPIIRHKVILISYCYKQYSNNSIMHLFKYQVTYNITYKYRTSPKSSMHVYGPLKFHFYLRHYWPLMATWKEKVAFSLFFIIERRPKRFLMVQWMAPNPFKYCQCYWVIYWEQSLGGSWKGEGWIDQKTLFTLMEILKDKFLILFVCLR